VDVKVALPLVITILLAIAGYLATYANSLRLARRSDRLDRINRQLRDLYGPLFALTSASNRTWSEFRQRYRPSGGFWDLDSPPTQDEAAAWRLWMSEVFMPLNSQMFDVVVQKADLLEEAYVPDCLLDLCSHVAAYRPVLKAWEKGDYSENKSLINFPREPLMQYVNTTFLKLKSEQQRLL
jgi:hypothetical protein